MKIPNINKFYGPAWIFLFIMLIADVITTYIGRNTAGIVESNQIIVFFNPGNNPFLHLIFVLGFFILLLSGTEFFRRLLNRKLPDIKPWGEIIVVLPILFSLYFLYCVWNNLQHIL